MKQLAELESESDDDHCSLDSVYDSDDNDALYIPEDFSSDSDSDSSYEPLRKNVCHDVQNSQQLFPSPEDHRSRVRHDSSAPTELTPSTQVPTSSTSASTQQHTSCVHPGPSSAPTELAPSIQVPTASTTSASAQQRGSGARSGPTKLLSIPELHYLRRNKYKWSATPMISKFSSTPKKNLLTGGNPGP